MDFFDPPKINLNNLTCHSGGADGSDSEFSKIGKQYGVTIRAYSYKTYFHQSPDKIEISQSLFEEGIVQINLANKKLRRKGIQKYMNLLARNWAQVKYSNQIFAIGIIEEKSNIQTVSGGTGYAVMMGIIHLKDVFVFEQLKNKWFRWSYISMSFMELKSTPTIQTENFAGIGTRKINENGKRAIKDLYEKTFKKNNI